MKTYRNFQSQTVKPINKKNKEKKLKQEQKLDRKLKDTFPASDSTSEY